MVMQMKIDVDKDTIRWIVLALLIVCGAGVNEMGLIV